MTKKLYYRQLPANMQVKMVETAYNTFTGARRNPPGVEVNRYGRARTNVEAAEEWRTYFEEQGFDPLQPWITTGTNKAQGLIFMYAAAKTDPGAIEVKWDPDARIYSTHFGAAMVECPAVRPVTTVEAQYEPCLDQERRPCLAINIKGAKPKRAGAADPEEMAARAEEEAAKQEAKAAARKRVAAAKQGGTGKGGAQTPEGAQGAGESTPPTE